MRTVALAGKPNAGKSTFFNAATRATVDVGNYPFTTIDPNRGITHVRTDCPCLSLAERCGNDTCREGTRFVPVELLDIAGLVPGAHEGRGLGNQFLDALTNAEVILHIVDASGGTNEEGEPVAVGSYDPRQDIDFIETEMDLWLAGIIERNWESIERQSQSPSFDIDASLTDMLTGVGASEYDVTTILRELEYPTDPRAWTQSDRETLAEAVRQRSKPIVIVANKADIAPTENLDALQEAAEFVIPCSAESELALRQADESGVVAYTPGDSTFSITGEVTNAQRDGLNRIQTVLETWEGTGVQSALNAAVYDRLNQITVYPVENETRWTDGQGNVLPDAFLLPAGSTPKDLAYAVHSDIGDGYLHAINARENRRIGEDHELTDGDVIKIVSTA